MDIAFVDQGDIGANAAETAAEQGIRREVVKRPEAKRGSMLLPRRWVVERNLAWTARFRRLVRDIEGRAETLAERRVRAFVIVLLRRSGASLASTPRMYKTR